MTMLDSSEVSCFSAAMQISRRPSTTLRRRKPLIAWSASLAWVRAVMAISVASVATRRRMIRTRRRATPRRRPAAGRTSPRVARGGIGREGDLIRPYWTTGDARPGREVGRLGAGLRRRPGAGASRAAGAVPRPRTTERAFAPPRRLTSRAVKLPNLVTLSRMCLAPAFLWAFREGPETGLRWALGLAVFFEVTDMVDGYVARRF